MFLIIADAYSKWVDMYPTTMSTTAVTIDKLRASFATWGLPWALCSDNASSFTCPAFNSFCASHGIEHLTSPPFSPKSNGSAERYIQTFNPRPAGGGRLNAPPSGFSRIAKKRRRAAPPGFHPPYPHLFRNFCENFGPRPCEVRSPGQVK